MWEQQTEVPQRGQIKKPQPGLKKAETSMKHEYFSSAMSVLLQGTLLDGNYLLSRETNSYSDVQQQPTTRVKETKVRIRLRTTQHIFRYC